MRTLILIAAISLALVGACHDENLWVCEVPGGAYAPIGMPCDESVIFPNQCVWGAGCYDGACRESCDVTLGDEQCSSGTCVEVDLIGACLTPCGVDVHQSDLSPDHAVCRESGYWGYDANLCGEPNHR